MFIIYQIIALLNPNKALTKNLSDNRHNQLIWFFSLVITRLFDIATKFAINKDWKNYFLIENKLSVCYLIQIFF